MGQRSTGLPNRRGFLLDASTVLVGYVAGGTKGRASATRTGAALLLNTRLEANNAIRILASPQSSNSAGGWIIEAAHVPEGGDLTSASTYAPIATITVTAGQPATEVILGGDQIRKAVATAGSLTGDVRVVAVRATAGTGSNGVAVPAGTNTVMIQPLAMC